MIMVAWKKRPQRPVAPIDRSEIFVVRWRAGSASGITADLSCTPAEAEPWNTARYFAGASGKLAGSSGVRAVFPDFASASVMWLASSVIPVI